MLDPQVWRVAWASRPWQLVLSGLGWAFFGLKGYQAKDGLLAL